MTRTVSYTHLDVYKRQSYSSLKVTGADAVKASVSGNELTLVLTFAVTGS